MSDGIHEVGDVSDETACRSLWSGSEPDIITESTRSSVNGQPLNEYRAMDVDGLSSTASYESRAEAVRAWNMMMRRLCMMWLSMARHDRTDAMEDAQLSLMGLSR
ncbi:hypothetical protein [uncultured Bifidobacterium sp.]|uniref:hypothetical protein n=1 Tax=uncultured Bifidobacterium sp. TaxID=165187 RepID=UPI002597A545|nr:hypothetical protein [uncultured Bifidobacterium sp.]